MFKKTLKRLTAGVTAAMLLVTSSAVAGAMEANRFVDVPPSAEGHRNTILQTEVHELEIGHAVNASGDVFCAQEFLEKK